MMIVLELLAFRVPALRAYFAAVLKFMYDADVLSEKTILRWAFSERRRMFSSSTRNFSFGTLSSSVSSSSSASATMVLSTTFGPAHD